MTGILLTASTSTVGGILSLATEVVTWFVQTMGSYLSFITDNPIIMIMFLLLLAGAGVGMLMRIWHSVC